MWIEVMEISNRGNFGVLVQVPNAVLFLSLLNFTPRVSAY